MEYDFFQLEALVNTLTTRLARAAAVNVQTDSDDSVAVLMSAISVPNETEEGV